MTARRPEPAANGRKTDGRATLRERAIVALLSQPSIAAAAESVGIGERTLRRWLREDAAFQAELAAQRRLLYETATARFQALTVRAVATLEELLGELRFPAIRLAAATRITEFAMHQYDADVILKRLAAVEAVQRER